MSSTYLMGTCQTESKQGIELLLQIGLCSGTYELVDELSVLEEHDGRDVADTHLSGNIVSLLHVALANDDAAVVFLCQLRDDGAYHTARATPGCPEINYQRHVAILQTLEILVCDVYFHCL